MMQQSTSRASPHIVKLDEAQIDACFKDQSHQFDVLINIYKLIFPQWENIQAIKGYPSCNDATWKAICRKFIDFDTAHHSSLAGGLWLNAGLSGTNETLKDWHVDRSSAVVMMKEGA